MSFPKTPFLQLIVSRLEHTRGRIASCVWQVDPAPLPARRGESRPDHTLYPADLATECSRPVTEYPHHWGRLYEQCWFGLDVEAKAIGEKRYLFWKDQAEATLYVDGVPWSGFDPAHKYARLPESFETVAVESTCCQSAIWHPDATGIDREGSRLEGAFLASRDEVAWKASHDYNVLLDLAIYQATRDGFDGKDLVSSERHRRPLDRVDPISRRIFTELDKVVDAFDAHGVGAIAKPLTDLLAGLEASSTSMAVTLTGHAHIDLVWLWPERVGEAKAVHTFATANQLLNQFPEFHFGYSQPASYEAVARRAPELMESVREHIESERWEATGAMYVESDTQLCCGEGLLRSFLLGQEGFRELTGATSEVVWLPDVFGYTGCLPTLMQETGAKYFFTTKQAWSNSTRFPFSSFRWRGFDGSEVVAHVLHSLLANCYNTTVAIGEVVEPTLTHQQAGTHPEALIPVGYGDGGGGPTEEMCERARRIATIDGVPPTRWGRIDDFFRRLDEKREELPVWQDEIYLQNHRGVQTMQVDLKQAFRELERALQYQEAAHALATRSPIDAAAWRRMVFAQFHDYIPGSSVQEVYDEGLPELRSCAEHAMAEVVRIAALTGSAPVVFNPHGQPVEHRIADDGQLKRGLLPPLSMTPISALEPIESDLSATDLKISNERVSARFNPEGEIVSLVIDNEPILIASSLNQLRVHPDHPVLYEAWNLDRQTPANPLPPVGFDPQPELTETAHQVVLTFSVELTDRSRAKVSYRLRSGEPVLRLEYEIDWQDQGILQANFPTLYTGRQARYGAPFGSIQRPQLARDLAADALFEVPASRWSIVGDDNEQVGLGVVTKDRYGFGCLDGSMHVSLVRSALVTNAPVNRELRDRAYPHDYSDLGTHRFELALCSGRLSAPRAEQPAALADTLFTPPLQLEGAPKTAGLVAIEGGDSLVIAWIKPADDGRGYLLRLHETRGLRGVATVRVADGWELEESCCLETRRESISLEADSVSFQPYGLISLRIFETR